MHPGVIVRVTPQEGPGESFAVTNEAGVEVMALRPGHYCFEAYDRDEKSFQDLEEQEIEAYISLGRSDGTNPPITTSSSMMSPSLVAT